MIKESNFEKSACRVLWIDSEDNPQVIEKFKAVAKENSVEIHHYSTASCGIKALSLKRRFFDAIIVDSEGYDDLESKNKGKKSTYSVNTVFGYLDNAKEYCMPVYIYTNNQEYLNNDFAKDYARKKGYGLFAKGSNNNKLFKSIKKKSNKLPLTILKNQHKEVFEILDEFDNKEGQRELTDMLLAINVNNQDFDYNAYFAHIRRVLESMFRHANKIKLLHDECICDGKVNLTNSLNFLSGEPIPKPDILCKKTHFTEIISKNVELIIYVTGACAHTGDQEGKTPDLQEHIDVLNTPHLMYTLIYMLMDILKWYSIYSKKNSDTSQNKGQWSDCTISGVLEKDGRGFYCGECSIQGDLTYLNSLIGEWCEVGKVKRNYNNSKFRLFAKSENVKKAEKAAEEE